MNKEALIQLFAGETLYLPEGPAKQAALPAEEMSESEAVQVTYKETSPAASNPTAGTQEKDLIVLIETDAEYTSLQMELLHKILQAIERDPKHIPVVRFGDFNKKEHLALNYLCFGLEIFHSLKDDSFRMYEGAKRGSRSFLFSDSLDKLNTHRDLKVKLWSLLKSTFID